jgi:adenosylhomocysteinase
VEIDLEDLNEVAVSKKKVRPWVEEYRLKNGRSIYLLGEGRLINLVAAEGHPSQVMDMSFSNQILSVKYILENAHNLENKVYKVPPEIDKYVASLKLRTLGITIDKLTKEQKAYLSSWQEGTK